MKPLGYYTSYTPGMGGVLEDIQARYGSYFERLNTREKFFLAKKLMYQINGELDDNGDLISELNVLANEQLNELPLADRLGIIRCLVDGVKVDDN